MMKEYNHPWCRGGTREMTTACGQHRANRTIPSTDLAILSIHTWVELHHENVLRAETSFTANVDSRILLCNGRAWGMYRRWQWLSQAPAGQCGIACTAGFWGEPAISASTAAANTPPSLGNQIIQNPSSQVHPCYPSSKLLKSCCGSRAQAGPPGSTV